MTVHDKVVNAPSIKTTQKGRPTGSESRERGRPIYSTKNRTGILYTVSHYEVGRGRRRLNFADLQEAKLAAARIASSIHNGELEVLKLTNADRSAYARALEFLRPLGRSIDMVAQEFAEASRVLDGTASLVEAAKSMRSSIRLGCRSAILSKSWTSC